MDKSDLINEILGLYQKHGWQLQHVLLTPESRGQLNLTQLRCRPQFEESQIDAIWFSRTSHGGREAWELRLLSEQPFALFETFEPDETKEQREEMRNEMEARMRDYATPAEAPSPS